MNIQIKKLELIEWIAQINDSNLISWIDKMRKTYLQITSEKIKPMSLGEFYASIDKAEEDIKADRVYTHDEVEKEAENW